MRRKASEAIFEGNGPIHQEEERGFGQPAPLDHFREITSLLKEREKILDRITRLLEQLSECLEHEARQPRLAMEADGPADTRRLASAWRAPQQQYKRCVGMAFLHAGLNPAQTPTRPVSAWRPNLPLSLEGMMSWSRAALPYPSRVSHPWRCAHQQPLVA